MIRNYLRNGLTSYKLCNNLLSEAVLWIPLEGLSRTGILLMEWWR